LRYTPFFDSDVPCGASVSISPKRSIALRLPGETAPCLDDPWQFLEHKQDVWAAVVGEVDACPDAVNVAWIRRVVPDDHDANRSRWLTDPIWRVVQAACFTSAPATIRRLIRRRQRVRDIERLDQQTYGLMVSRVAERHPEGGQWDVSMAIREVVPALQRETMRPGKDFGELVRERRRQRAVGQERARQRVVVAERRMQEAFLALEEAERCGLSERELVGRERVCEQEVAAYAAAVASLEKS
jgi:hypothetical protein